MLFYDKHKKLDFKIVIEENSVTKNCYCCDNIKNKSDQSDPPQSYLNKTSTFN